MATRRTIRTRRLRTLRSSKGNLKLIARELALALERARSNEAELAALRTKNQILHAITEGTTDCVFVKDRRARYVLINSAGARAFGLSPEEVIGKHDNELFTEESSSQIEERDAAVMASREMITYECTSIVRSDARGSGSTEPHDSIRVWQSTKGPWLDAAGNVIGVVGISRDITERKNMEDTQRLLAEASGVLGASLEYEATLAETAKLLVPAFADSAAIHVLEGSELRCLAALGDGASADDLARSVVDAGRARALHDLGEEERRQLLSRGFHSLLSVPISARDETLGCICFFSKNPWRLRSPIDIAFALEIGRRAGIAIDRGRMYRKAEEASHLKDQFLGLVSHELRTPITAILGWTNALRKGHVSDEAQAKALATIERNAKAQARLIEDLMDATSIMANKFQIQYAAVDLAMIMEMSIEAAAPLADAKGVTLRPLIEPSVLTVLGDDSRLGQVVDNLLVNAIKFTPRGGVIEIGCRKAERALVWVQDNGEGIDPSVMPFIFERFRQGDSTTRRRHSGLGLGLSIVKHIVEAHGGSVSAHSRGPGLGSTFAVELPLHAAASASQEVPAAEPTPRRLSAAGKKRAHPRVNP